jgi:hypothetical protein
MNGFDLWLGLRRKSGRDLAKAIGEHETVVSKIRSTLQATPTQRKAIARELNAAEELVFMDAQHTRDFVLKLSEGVRMELAARMLETNRQELAVPIDNRRAGEMSRTAAPAMQRVRNDAPVTKVARKR